MNAVREFCSSRPPSLRHISRYHRPHSAPESGKIDHQDVHHDKKQQQNNTDEVKCSSRLMTTQCGRQYGEYRGHPERHPQAGPEEGWKKPRSEEHTSELQSRSDLVCRLLLEKKKSTT